MEIWYQSSCVLGFCEIEISYFLVSVGHLLWIPESTDRDYRVSRFKMNFFQNFWEVQNFRETRCRWKYNHFDDFCWCIKIVWNCDYQSREFLFNLWFNIPCKGKSTHDFLFCFCTVIIFFCWCCRIFNIFEYIQISWSLFIINHNKTVYEWPFYLKRAFNVCQNNIPSITLWLKLF